MLHLLFLQALLSTLGAASSADVHSYKYEVMPESLLSISGKSNVASFSCYNAEVVQKGSFMAFEPQGVNAANFYNARIDLKVKSMNCHSRLIERDLGKSLLSDRYPVIQLNFNDAKLVALYPNSTAKYQATLKMTLAATTREVKVDIFLQQLSRNTYRLTGGLVVDMTQFNIKQPTAMLGLVVVDKEINISFNIVALVYKDILGD
jgi:polyisoprenoid-binding protein YceI